MKDYTAQNVIMYGGQTMGAVFDPYHNNSGNPKKYECPICLKKFDSELRMAVHFNMDHGQLRRGSR